MAKTRLTIMLLGVMLWATSAMAQVVIVNSDNPVSQLSRDQLRTLFAMRVSQWANQTPVHVYVLPDNHPLHIDFCKKILELFPYQLRRIWDRQVFSGTGIAPITVKSEQDMIAHIARDKGAIGYIRTIHAQHAIKAIEAR